VIDTFSPNLKGATAMTAKHTADVGLIGLAVMGQNLALNMADHGFSVAVYNRTTRVTHDFITRHTDTPGMLIGCTTVDELVQAVKPPRRIVVLVKAGMAVDDVTQQLIDSGLNRDDLVVDCGNSEWTETIRREKAYAGRCRFFGSGVSGGEVGARFGPSLMPGGDADAWGRLQPIWEAIAAKVDEETGRPIETGKPGRPVQRGVPCTTYIGPNGAGHYVKMIHNGIEYIDMQLISEAYMLMRTLLGAHPNELSRIFAAWNDGALGSYLIEITADILQQRDPDHADGFLVDAILDTASQKGTGKWTSIDALDLGVPANAIAAAVFARFLSALKDERGMAAQHLKGPQPSFTGDRDTLIQAVHDALYGAKVCAYAQGFQLMREAQQVYGWHLDMASIARIWRGGCIIRARLLQNIATAYSCDPTLPNLLVDPYVSAQIEHVQYHWRYVVAQAASGGIPVPGFMATLAYYDGYRCARLPANLIQAQRDYFGAHTYERTDRPRGKFFHLDWSGAERRQSLVE
jgi:6-phosphogluconate dehydrogenase